jgi:preprotein translocase subunit SecA
MGVLGRILRGGEGKKIKTLAGIVPEVNALGPTIAALSDDALRGKTAEFRLRLARGEEVDDLLVEAFAVVREASTRVIGQRHYDVQLMGATALHAGCVAEIRTGEGKTLVSTLPVYLNALTGKGVHLVTVNNYLARRGAVWMGQIHRWLGLSVGLVGPGVRAAAAEKRGEYRCDVTYGTYNEFGLDYLRDNMANTVADKVQRGHHYAIVDDVDSILIDEARTPLSILGRAGHILEGHRWSEGSHQAVEAKEGVKIKEEKQTLATITLQNYFRMYGKLAGMGDTTQMEAAELMNTYGLNVVPILTNRPMVRKDESDIIYKSEEAKFKSVVDDIVARHERGQPVLVGTVSVEKSEVLSRKLQQRGVKHEVLNAKQHTKEAAIVAQAGRIGAVTVATNMAGRGVDILLGGNPEGMARNQVLNEGHHPDTLRDEFALPVALEKMPIDYITARRKAHERFAELVRKYSKMCAEEGERVRALGGLHVLGTERHEGRRIDNQLRGRAGRRGDPGSSRFYLSLDDELMRLFATGALSWVMSRALPDDEAIDAKMVTKAIERAQNTVEQRNAEIRKNVLKDDEMMNEQRRIIYQRRDGVPPTL